MDLKINPTAVMKLAATLDSSASGLIAEVSSLSEENHGFLTTEAIKRWCTATDDNFSALEGRARDVAARMNASAALFQDYEQEVTSVAASLGGEVQ